MGCACGSSAKPIDFACLPAWAGEDTLVGHARAQSIHIKAGRRRRRRRRRPADVHARRGGKFGHTVMGGGIF